MIDDDRPDEDTTTPDEASEPNTAPGEGGAPDAPPADNDTATDNGDETDSDTTPPEGDTFPREYVEELRSESAGYRTRVRDLEAKMHRLMVEQTGLLADPADLEFDAAHLDDPAALTAAIEALLEAKPHLKARRFAPDGAGQGPKGTSKGDVDLLGILRANA